MTLEPGSLVLVPFPFTNLKSAKRRPAVVLSSRSYNAGSRHVVVCGVTSNLANSSHSVLISQRDMAEGKLLVDLRVKADKVLSIEQAIVGKKVGRLRDAVMRRVYAELLSILPQQTEP